MLSKPDLGERGNINVVAFIFQLNNETKVRSINAKKKKRRKTANFSPLD